MPQVSNGNRYSGTFTSSRRITNTQSGRKRIDPSIGSRNGNQHRDRNIYHTVQVKRPLPDVPTEKKWTLVPGFCCISGGIKDLNVEPVRRKSPQAVDQEKKMPNIKGRVNDFFHRQLSLVTPSTTTAEPTLPPTNTGSTNTGPTRVKPRRSHSLKENSSNARPVVTEKKVKPTVTTEKVKRSENGTSGSGKVSSGSGKASSGSGKASSGSGKASSGSFITRYLDG